MACGEYGSGKFAEPIKISNVINNYFKNLEENKKFKALVTAGPTREYIDPVRFITNRSSGKTRLCNCRGASKKWFSYNFISGPTNLKSPDGVEIINVNSAQEMYEKTIENLPVDVAIFAAAVADFRSTRNKKNKIKKKTFENLEIEKTKDILDYTSKHNN